MSGSVMGDVWENSPAKGAELLLLLAIAYFADEDGYASETVDTLARKARMSTSSVYRATSGLESKGLLKVVERGQGRAPSAYHVPRSGVRLTPLRTDGGARSGVNLTPQADVSSLWSQSDTTTDSASGRNLTPQSALSSQSDTTTDAPIEGTRASAHARVGGRERTTPPTNPPTGADRASASPTPIDDDAFEFMASLELKRTPRINEQREIADLFATKIAAGFTAAEIRDSVGGNWEGVRDRVRVLISRFKEMSDRPLRRPRTQSAPAQPLSECANCAAPIKGPLAPDGLCAPCREFRVADEYLKTVPERERTDALKQASNEGLTDEQAQKIRAVEILYDLYGRDSRKSGD